MLVWLCLLPFCTLGSRHPPIGSNNHVAGSVSVSVSPVYQLGRLCRSLADNLLYDAVRTVRRYNTGTPSIHGLVISSSGACCGSRLDFVLMVVRFCCGRRATESLFRLHQSPSSSPPFHVVHAELTTATVSTQ